MLIISKTVLPLNSKVQQRRGGFLSTQSQVCCIWITSLTSNIRDRISLQSTEKSSN